MNLFSDIRTLVISALDQLVQSGDLPSGLDTANVAVEPPRDPLHGDMATNAAMVLSKPAGLKPREIADKLALVLAADPRITTAEVAGPGFLNMRLAASVWQGVVGTALANGADFGRSDMGAGWGFGARLYRVPAALGLSFIGDRWADKVDSGDSFQP